MDPKKFLITPISQAVWEDRYALKDENGKLKEKDIFENFKRVSKAIASKEKLKEKWEKAFFNIMSKKQFCPAGRILANAGTHFSQLLNCYVLPFKNDSLDAIMETARNMAVTQKFGGGCIGGESIVLTDKGPLSIKELVESKDSYKVFSYNPDNSEMEFCEVLDKHVTPMGGDRVYEIEFDNFRGGVAAKIRASDWHPFFVFDGEKIVEIRADDLKPGMAIIGSSDLSVGYDSWSWLLGYIAGDGDISQNGSENYTRIRIVDQYKNCIQRAAEIMGVSFDLSKDYRYGIDVWACEAYADVADKVKKEFSGYQKCYTKHVPESIWKSSSEKRLSFLAGYFDADGFFNKEKKRFESFSVSKRLSHEILALAGSLGIRASIRFRKARKENERDGWEVSLLKSQYISNCISQISAKYTISDINFVQGSVSFSEKWKDKLFETAGIDVRTDAARRAKTEIGPMSVSLAYWLQHGKATRETASNIIRECGEKELAQAVLSCQIVKSSKPTYKDETLYDLTVNKNQNYLASDPTTGAFVVVHNTGFNYSTLRPSGSHIKGVNGRSCGVPGFIDMMSVTSGVIEQGGCLTKDSLVNTDEGLLYLSEMIPDEEPGWYDQECLVKTKDGDEVSNRFYVNGYSFTLQVITDDGRVIKGTPNHKIYVLSPEGYVWKQFDELNAGDWVVSKLGQHVGTPQKLRIDISKDHYNCIAPERFPSEVDEDFAFFIGYYVANGFSTKKEHDHRFGLSIPHKSYLNGVVEGMLKSFFGDNISVKSMQKEEDKSKIYYLSNRMIKEFLEINGLLKKDSPSASVPSVIRRSPPKIVASFMAGFFEADGSLSHGYPSCNSSSLTLLREIQCLLMGLGIPCKIRSQLRGKGSFSSTKMYQLRVQSFVGLKRWVDLVSINEESRFVSCRNHKPDLSRETAYTLPHAQFWLGKVIELLDEKKYKDTTLSKLRKRLKRYVSGKRTLTLSSYEELMEVDFISGSLRDVDNFYFSQVTSITHGEDYTYDMEVPRSHSYIANSYVSHNSRRGANMGILEIWHPDVWNFISYKNDHEWDRLLEFMNVLDNERWEYFKKDNQYKLQMYNVSIGVTDEFLDALINDKEWSFKWGDTEWDLYKVQYKNKFTEKSFDVIANCDETAKWKVRKIVPYPAAGDIFEIISKRKLKATEIWDKLCYNAWSNGCPGVVNISEARRMHNGEYFSPLLGTNPCGEQWLPGNASCNLGSIVLPSFLKIKNDEVYFDYGTLKDAVHTAVRFMDDVIDNCDFPLPEMKKLAQKERRIGLGTMGLHDMLIGMKLRYDSDEGREFVSNVLTLIRDEAYKTSVNLAKEKGSFSGFKTEKFLESGYIKKLPETLRKGIAEHGIRNVTLITQAPTGTTGTLLSTSTGCEPWFAMTFDRHTGFGSYVDGCQEYISWRKEHPEEEKPDYFKTSMEIDPEDHLKMMILFSDIVDSSVSKTINLPYESTVDDVKKIFLKALENGVKGITIFRDGCRRGVLENKDNEKEEKNKEKEGKIEIRPEDLDEITSLDKQHSKPRGNRVAGATTRIHMDNHNMYVTVNKNVSGEIVEVFATVGENKQINSTETSGVEDSWAEGLGKMISLALRAGVKPTSILKNLKSIPSDKPVFSTIGDCEFSELIPSPPHAIARVVEEEIKYIYPKMVKKDNIQRKVRCKKCGSENAIPTGPTCYECLDCGASGCGGD